MAQIEIEYFEGYCTFDDGHYCDECHTIGESLCRSCYLHEPFFRGDDGCIHVPYEEGCIHADYKTLYKGIKTDSYEMEPYRDIFSGHEWMDVTIKRKTYHCSKVTLNGKVIYLSEEEEDYCSCGVRRDTEGAEA